jgi:hypothetical protein
MQQQHSGKQVDGPDEPIVNEQEQTVKVNPEEKKYENKEKGYEEGNRNDSDTDEKQPAIKKNNKPTAEE